MIDRLANERCCCILCLLSSVLKCLSYFKPHGTFKMNQSGKAKEYAAINWPCTMETGIDYFERGR